MRRSALEHQAAVRDQMELASIYTATSHLSAVSTIGQRVQSLEYTLASMYALCSHLPPQCCLRHRSESANFREYTLSSIYTATSHLSAVSTIVQRVQSLKSTL